MAMEDIISTEKKKRVNPFLIVIIIIVLIVSAVLFFGGERKKQGETANDLGINESEYYFNNFTNYDLLCLDTKASSYCTDNNANYKEDSIEFYNCSSDVCDRVFGVYNEFSIGFNNTVDKISFVCLENNYTSSNKELNARKIRECGIK